MLLQHLKRRGTQIDLPLILGATGIGFNQNFVPNSEVFFGLASGASGSLGHSDPFGGNGAMRLDVTSGWVYITSSSTSFTTLNVPFTVSVYAKTNPNTIIGAEDSFKWSDDTGKYLSSVFTATSEWQRFSHTYNSLEGGVMMPRILISAQSTPVANLDFFGWQLNEGNEADPYTKTTGAVKDGTIDLELPVTSDSTDYKLDIDWGDGNKIRYEGTGTSLFNDSFTYTEDAFPDIGVFNADVPTDYSTWIDYIDFNSALATINGNTLIDSDNQKRGVWKKFDYDKNYNLTEVNININKETLASGGNESFFIGLRDDMTASQGNWEEYLLVSKISGDVMLRNNGLPLVSPNTTYYNIVDNGTDFDITVIWNKNTNVSTLELYPSNPPDIASTGQVTINSISLKAYTQPDIKIWARNGAANNLNFNRTSWNNHLKEIKQWAT